jgi:hypothetical protein
VSKNDMKRDHPIEYMRQYGDGDKN